MIWNGLELPNSDKIILDLCGGTGAWSKPYRDNGYDVHLITLPKYDVRTYNPPDNVYGILAAPPCTEFSGSGARWWKSKPDNLLIEALEIVHCCLRIISVAHPSWWALENPVGRLPRYIGKYLYTFQPCDYGDSWTKRTCIWGEHNILVKNPVKPTGKNPIHFMPPTPDRPMLRAITPPGFARAFYEANK